MPIDYLLNTECVEITSANPSQLALRQEIRTFPGAKLSEIVPAAFQQIAAEISILRTADPHRFAEVMKHAFVLVDFQDSHDLAAESDHKNEYGQLIRPSVRDAFGAEFWRCEATQYFTKMASYRSSRLVTILLLIDGGRDLECLWHGAALKSYGSGISPDWRSLGMQVSDHFDRPREITYTFGPVQLK